ncbi:MAG: hypothetical protein C0418_01400 [Coriobacteriaceae bacterium]|nr:hypothetical protein [Coriobacteriaceae bacterium]
MYQQPYVQPPAARNDPDYIAFLEQRITALERRLPNTRLIAPSFWTRMWAVFGHYFVASFILGIIVWLISFVLALVFGASIAAMLPQLQQLQ